MARFLGNGGCGCPDSGQVPVTGGETETATDKVSSQGVVTTDVKVSDHPQNLLQVVGDGLMVSRAECCDVDGSETKVEAGEGVMVSGNGTDQNPYVIEASNRPGNGALNCRAVRRCLSAGDGLDYDEVTGEIKARPSRDDGNAMTVGDDGGLYVPNGNGCCCNGGGGKPGNGDGGGNDGDTPEPITVEGGESESATADVTKDGTTYTVTPETKVSGEPGNALAINDDGLYVPASGGNADGSETILEAGDNVTVDGTGTADDPYIVSATSSGDGGGGTPPQLDGGETETATNSVNGDVVTTDVKVSPRDDNALTIGDDGLYVPTTDAGQPTALEAGDGVTVEGAGTADDPYVLSAEAGCPPADAADAWSYDAEDTNGAPVFCASDNVLRTVPERFFDAMRLDVTSSSGDVPLNEITGVDEGRNTLAEVEGEFVNPSPVLPMRTVVEVAVNHVQWTIMSGNSRAQLWSRVELGGDVEGVVEAHQRIEDDIETRSIFDFMGSTKTLVVTIPPGGTMTVHLMGQMALEAYEDALGNELNHAVTIWGGN